MKANELMIGDWVQYNGVACIIYGLEMPLPRKNERFNNKAIIHLYCNGFIDALEEEVSPIPLTAEILEKNGFESISASEDFLYLSSFSHRFRRIEYIPDAALLAVKGCRIPICIKYVHELQHALRLCGLNDLADSIII